MKLKTLGYLSLITLVASLSPAAHAQTFSVIHAFTGGSDGGFPDAGVSIRDGNLYGTAYTGGVGNGTVYEILHSGSNWTTIPLSSFFAGGRSPLARVVFGPDGQLYGTTAGGGACDNGVVFRLTVPATICKTASCLSQENVLHQFACHFDGALPWYGDVIWDRQGNIYGTTYAGGEYGGGTVYELMPSGDSYTESVLYSFSDGGPKNGVIFDSNGNLFGTTINGGLYGFGTVYELTYSLGVGWIKTDLYDFQNGSDGSQPLAGLTFDSASNLYGAAGFGGSANGGTVFELTPLGNVWTFKVLDSLSGVPQGYACGPYASLTMDTAGDLYGTTLCDGAHNLGTVFKLTNTGNGWEYTLLHDFDGGDDGERPLGKMTLDTDGSLYGTTALGGSGSYGVVWMIKP